MSVVFEPITPTIGAYVHVNAGDVAQDGVPGRILDALNRYNVLVFPQVHMSDDTFLALTAAMGVMHDNTVTDDGTAVSQKGIFRIALDKDQKTQREFILANDFWHIDGMSYSAPVKATLLKCESAPIEGGDTGFANLYAAYEALPDERKQALANLKVGHCLSSSVGRLYAHPTPEDFARWDAIFPRLEHPLIWQQKDGRSSMLIGATANDITGMETADSRKLIDELENWATQDRFTYRHKWQDGDLVIFNNPGLLHRSYPYDEAAQRIMHRTTLKGHEMTALSESRTSDIGY